MRKPASILKTIGHISSVIFWGVIVVVWYMYNFQVLHSIYKPHHEKNRVCLCDNKGADQLCSNYTADQRLCFRYTDSTISLQP